MDHMDMENINDKISLVKHKNIMHSYSEWLTGNINVLNDVQYIVPANFSLLLCIQDMINGTFEFIVAC